jgi:hypothetical protein
MMAKKIVRAMRFKKVPEKKEHGEVTCGNCQTIYNGNYCPECGQPAKEFDRPFSFVFYDFLGNIIAIDSRLLKTFIALVAKPGYLTKDFFEGKRVKYSPPFRAFIFLSFVMFLLLQYLTNIGLSKALENNVNKGKIHLNNINDQIVFDSLKQVLPLNMDSVINTKGLETEFNFDFDTLHASKNLNSSLLNLADQMSEKLKTTSDPKKQRKLKTYIGLCRSPEQAIAKILKYISWAFFLLLPIFALILKLFYIRRNQNYVRHLIFSIHLHSFWFMVAICILLLNMIFRNVADWIPMLLFIGCGVYFIIALKIFYKQGIKKTILKGLLISLVYFFVLTSTVMIAMLNALSII